jgi:hypothetical protein
MFRRRNKECKECSFEFYDSSKLRYRRRCNSCLIKKKKIRLLFAKYMKGYNTTLGTVDIIDVKPIIDKNTPVKSKSRRLGKVACTPDTTIY